MKWKGATTILLVIAVLIFGSLAIMGKISNDYHTPLSDRDYLAYIIDRALFIISVFLLMIHLSVCSSSEEEAITKILQSQESNIRLTETVGLIAGETHREIQLINRKTKPAEPPPVKVYTSDAIILARNIMRYPVKRTCGGGVCENYYMVPVSVIQKISNQKPITVMNQNDANLLFEKEEFKEAKKLYTTSDGRAFINQQEAVRHANGTFDANEKPLVDQSVKEWLRPEKQNNESTSTDNASKSSD